MERSDRDRLVRRTPSGEVGEIERLLLRRSVDALAAERHHCADCGRTPLVGETVHVFPAGELVCELCRALRPGEPVSSELVRHSERGLTVRVTRSA